MSISIRDFKTWASNNGRTAVEISNGSLAAAARVGFFARIFGSGKVTNRRRVAMEEFTRALSSRYGVSIAKQAISRAGLSSKSELRGSTIMRVIGIAKEIRNSTVRAPEPQDLRLSTLSINQAAIGPDDQRFLHKFLRQRAVVVELLGEMPLSKADYDDFHSRALDAIERLTALRNSIIPANLPADDFIAAVDSLISTLSAKDGQSFELLAGGPLGEKNVQQYRDTWREATITAIDNIALAVVGQGHDDAATVIQQVGSRFVDDPQTIQDFNREAGLSKNVFKNIALFAANMINERLASENIRNVKVNPDVLATEIKFGFRLVLNERPWEVVQKGISTSIGGAPVELTSTISPAEQLGHSDESERGPIADRYPPHMHGFMSHSANADHAVNLSVSSLSVGNPGGGQELVFAGVRHGVHCAWEIPEDDKRARANARRAEEAVIAAFLAKYDVPPGHVEFPEPGADNTIEVPLDMTSVSLLTPDKLRHRFKADSDSDERKMLIEQNAAWDSVAEKGVTFRYKGKNIRVKPRIVKFNLGVNEGAVNRYSKLAPDQLGGWDFSAKMNRTAFGVLEGEVTAYLAANAGDPNAGAIQTLLDQCRLVFRTRAERSDSNDAYKVAARLAVLSRLIGKVPCWNCKSGKDRTGEMDVECKFLSTLIARGMRIPEPGEPLSEEQKSLFRAIALKGGNFEIQKMNSGIGGFKTGSIDSITSRLGGKRFREYHKGGSDHVSV